MDLLAVAFILLPSMVAAFSKTWYLTDYYCYVHGGLILWFHLVTFGLISVMFVERMVKITNTNLYAKVFTSSRVVSLLSALVWIFTLLVIGVSASPWLTISYNFYHAACAVNLDDNIYYTSIVVALGMVASLIVCIVCIVKIFKFKKQAEKANNDKKNNISSINEEPDDKSKSTGGGGGFGALLSQTKTSSSSTSERKVSTTGIGASSSGGGGGKPPKNKLALMAARKKIKKAVNKTKVTKLFSLKEDNGDPNLHMMVTYIIVWVTMFVCHAPYFAINIADFFDSGDIWGGYYSITVIFFMVSYCMKPVVYLAHNRNYRKGYKETMPENVIEKANVARKSVSDFMTKLDKAMFKTPGKKKLDATLNTHMAANKWLRKVKNKKGAGGGALGAFGKLKPKSEPTKADDKREANVSRTSENPQLSQTESGGQPSVNASSAGNVPPAVRPLSADWSPSPSHPAPSPAVVTSRDVDLAEKGVSPSAAGLATQNYGTNGTDATEPVPENDDHAPSANSKGTSFNRGKLKSIVNKQMNYRRLSKMAHVFEIEDGDQALDFV